MEQLLPETPLALLILIYAAIWVTIHIGSGYVAHRLPLHLFDREGLLCRERRWEGGGRLYRRLLVHRWKDAMPEAGSMFSGGFSKRALTGRDPAYLQRFVAETCRAEFSHWLAVALGLTFFVWNHWVIGAFMMVYALGTNLPFILIQRYNRIRFRRVLRRYSRR